MNGTGRFLRASPLIISSVCLAAAGHASACEDDKVATTRPVEPVSESATSQPNGNRPRLILNRQPGAVSSDDLEARLQRMRSEPSRWRISADESRGGVPAELGAIAWHRRFDQAAEAAKKLRKPLLVLFQEVPGCETCVNYGQDVLRHPLIVEAAETLFVPVVVFNNVAGDDEATLKSFKEPPFNNPVVRIMDATRHEIVPRMAGEYGAGALAIDMVAALQAEAQESPNYLRLMADEDRARRRDSKGTAIFAMHCFWEGEAALGLLPGVLRTRPGMLDQREVVEVEFDTAVVDYAALVREADKSKCTDRVFTRSDAQQLAASRIVTERAVRSNELIEPDSKPKHYLAESPLRFVPMTEIQASRVNGALGKGGDPETCLSPRQKSLLDQIRKHPDAKWQDSIGRGNLVEAWAAAQSFAATLND